MIGKHHMGQSIRGALLNNRWKRGNSATLVGCVKDDDGNVLNSLGVFNWLCDQLKLGHEVYPYGECDNWDWVKGCQGHEIKEES